MCVMDDRWHKITHMYKNLFIHLSHRKFKFGKIHGTAKERLWVYKNPHTYLRNNTQGTCYVNMKICSFIHIKNPYFQQNWSKYFLNCMIQRWHRRIYHWRNKYVYMKVLQSDDLWFYFEENKQILFPFCWHNLRSRKSINEQTMNVSATCYE